MSNDVIEFGSYYQNDNEQKQPIKWIVIQQKDNKVLLLSSRVLKCINYLPKEKKFLFINISFYRWKDSLARQWLNNDFINEAFSEKEQSFIVTKKIATTTRYPGLKYDYYYNDQPNTVDKIFMLSEEEFERSKISKNFAKAKPIRVIHKEVDTDLEGVCVWHLRTGTDPRSLFIVNEKGELSDVIIRTRVLDKYLYIFIGWLIVGVMLYSLFFYSFSFYKAALYLLGILTFITFILIFLMILNGISYYFGEKRKQVYIRPAMWIDLQKMIDSGYDLNIVKVGEKG